MHCGMVPRLPKPPLARQRLLRLAAPGVTVTRIREPFPDRGVGPTPRFSKWDKLPVAGISTCNASLWWFTHDYTPSCLHGQSPREQFCVSGRLDQAIAAIRMLPSDKWDER
jgi:hypothetical protein